MTFSIVVPIFKVEKYLKQCIDSILNQTYCDFELILVDDGSPDKCGEICDGYSLIDKRVKVLHKKNGGLTSARKAGCLVASNDFIVCIDGDDFVKPDFLETINSSYDENIDIYVIGYEDDLHNVYANYQSPGVYDSAVIFNSFLTDETRPFYNGGCISYSLWTKIIRRNLYVKNQKSTPNSLIMGEDLFVSSLCVRDAKMIKVLDYNGYIYRSNPSSITRAFSDSRINQFFSVINELTNIYVDNMNKVYLYSYYAYFNLLKGIARSSKGFKSFKLILKNDKKMFFIRKMALKAFFKKSSFKYKILVFLTKHNLLFLEYLLYKSLR